LWVAPEDAVKTYAPDNGPVAVRIEGGVLEATQPVEPLTGIEKQITVKMQESGTGVTVTHRLRNASGTARDVAPWALTMMARGGRGVHPFPPRGTHPEMLAPVNPLVMWAFTDLSDPRWGLSRKYLTLRQDPANAVPQKLGSYNRKTLGAYVLNGEMFLKRYDATAPPAAYPDMGCSFEMFTNAEMLELETLGPLERLAGGESATHVEHWSLHRAAPGTWSDDELDRVLGAVIG
jgi:hypothetical protein